MLERKIRFHHWSVLDCGNLINLYPITFSFEIHLGCSLKISMHEEFKEFLTHFTFRIRLFNSHKSQKDARLVSEISTLQSPCKKDEFLTTRIYQNSFKN